MSERQTKRGKERGREEKTTGELRIENTSKGNKETRGREIRINKARKKGRETRKQERKGSTGPSIVQTLRKETS